MTGTPRAEDPRLLSVAASISEGMPVEWAQVYPDPDAETTAVVEQLRVLEGVCRMSNPIPDTWGPFNITGEIGHGAYGTVYRAFDANLNLEVALKVIPPQMPSSYVDPSRGLNEARLLAKVNHPNVVRVYRAERVGQEVGLSMELVQGRTLSDLVRLHGPFSAKETMLIGVDVCCALAAVHGAGLVHGDIKAQNVMRATGGRTVLMDFGAGYDVKSDRSSGHGFAGTPLYLAPEVFAGTRTAVSDIYSVGVLLYYLVAGSYPITGHTRSEVMHQHEQHAPRRLLRDIRPDLPDAFIRVVDRAMAERPEDRYETAGELEAALKRALSNEDVAPISPPPFLFPNNAALAAAGVLLALGLAYGLWNMGRDTGAQPRSVVAEPPQPAAAPPSTAADTYRIEAAFYREQNGTELRLQPGARVAPGDQLFLQVVSSVPTYLYVVNEDDYGEAFLLFPLPGQPQVNPLPAGTRHEIPGAVNGERITWTVSSAGGREHFLIFASPQPPSPAFERVFAALPRPSLGTRVLAQPLSNDLARELRGVGGLTKTRGVGGLTKTPVQTSGTGLSAEFGVPLSNAEETARGVWVRQLTLENPRR